MNIADEWKQPLADQGFTTAEAFFEDERILAWRTLPERDNAILDLPGQPRLHIKRFCKGGYVQPELAGIQLLKAADIPTLEVVAWVDLGGRGLLVTRDLTGLSPADALLRSAPSCERRRTSFERLLAPTARVAATLHRANLHHRDLYLCHFLLRPDGGDCHLIDAARVRRLPWLTRRRWIVKDLAQFVYSAHKARVPTDQIDAWLERWAKGYGTDLAKWRRAISSKALVIAAKDARASTRARDVSFDTFERNRSDQSVLQQGEPR